MPGKGPAHGEAPGPHTIPGFLAIPSTVAQATGCGQPHEGTSLPWDGTHSAPPTKQRLPFCHVTPGSLGTYDPCFLFLLSPQPALLPGTPEAPGTAGQPAPATGLGTGRAQAEAIHLLAQH